MKPLFGNKIKGNSNIVVVEGNDLVADKKSSAETFNNYLVNVTLNLGVNILDDDVSSYNNHPSIITIGVEIIISLKVLSSVNKFFL